MPQKQRKIFRGKDDHQRATAFAMRMKSRECTVWVGYSDSRKSVIVEWWRR